MNLSGHKVQSDNVALTHDLFQCFYKDYSPESAVFFCYDSHSSEKLNFFLINKIRKISI